MKRITGIGIVVAVAGSCCVIAAYFSSFYYNLYANARTELQARTDALEAAFGDLKARWPDRLHVHRVFGTISTTAPQPSQRYNELRLPLDSTNAQQFTLECGKWAGRIQECWLADWEPRTELYKFEQFKVHAPTNYGSELQVTLKPKHGESIEMKFEVLVLAY